MRWRQRNLQPLGYVHWLTKVRKTWMNALPLSGQPVFLLQSSYEAEYYYWLSKENPLFSQCWGVVTVLAILSTCMPENVKDRATGAEGDYGTRCFTAWERSLLPVYLLSPTFPFLAISSFLAFLVSPPLPDFPFSYRAVSPHLLNLWLTTVFKCWRLFYIYSANKRFSAKRSTPSVAWRMNFKYLVFVSMTHQNVNFGI